MGTIIRQIWACTVCKTQRVCGSSVIHDKLAEPYLLCEICNSHTKHRFVNHSIGEMAS